MSTEESGISFETARSWKNGYQFECKKTKRNCKLFICSHIIKAKEEGRLDSFEDCSKAIDGNACLAVKMMAKEEEEGKPLFFKKAMNPFEATAAKSSSKTESGKVDKKSDSYKRGRLGSKSLASSNKSKVTYKTTKKKPEDTSLDVKTFEDALNTEAEKHAIG